MKRAMTAGSHRGPVAPGRQRRTLRFVQILLVLTAGALIALAGYSYGRVAGYEDARRSDALDAPRRPSIVQPIVLVALGGVALGAAFLLQDPRGGVRMPTPARLDEFAGRAEQAAIEKAERSGPGPGDAPMDGERAEVGDGVTGGERYSEDAAGRPS